MSKARSTYNSALVLFFGALILYILALFIDSSNLELFCRPVIIPSLFFYYYIKVKGKVNLLFSISILSYFVGEMLYLISEKDFFCTGLIFFIIPYFIITYFLYQDYVLYIKEKKHSIDTLSVLIVVFFLIYLLYTVLSFVTDSSKFEFVMYLVFALLLLVMTIFAFLIQLNHSSKTILFMVLMVMSFIISDIFFIFSNMMEEVFSLLIIKVLVQQLSYFLFVGYFIHRTNRELWKEN